MHGRDGAGASAACQHPWPLLPSAWSFWRFGLHGGTPPPAPKQPEAFAAIADCWRMRASEPAAPRPPRACASKEVASRGGEAAVGRMAGGLLVSFGGEPVDRPHSLAGGVL